MVQEELLSQVTVQLRCRINGCRVKLISIEMHLSRLETALILHGIHQSLRCHLAVSQSLRVRSPDQIAASLVARAHRCVHRFPGCRKRRHYRGHLLLLLHLNCLHRNLLHRLSKGLQLCLLCQNTSCHRLHLLHMLAYVKLLRSLYQCHRDGPRRCQCLKRPREESQSLSIAL